jgi:DNA-binding winged helix-turn-helix (wHTH) protein/TolB-like protein
MDAKSLIYHFDDVSVDLEKFEVIKADSRAHLEPKAFEVLVFLIENRGRLVEKKELLDAVWKDAFVTENAMTRVIAQLRKALEEDSKEAKYIETVPTLGYRFIAEVQIVDRQRESHSVADAATGATDERGGSLLNSRRWLTVSVVAMLVIAAVVYALYFHRGFATRPPEIKSLAVLPPRPLQSTERDEALEMGTASALITRLGSLRQLIVRPESAVERYARPDQDPLAAGREQKVDAVLDSRYQRSGDKFRFTLRLLRVADGATLWADTLDQHAADPFAIQDALAGKVTSALRLTLNSAEKELLAKRHTSSAEAWQLYVRGRHLVHQRGIPEIETAITYFQRAIALDHEFALAHVMLGASYYSLSWLGHSPAKELMPKAKIALDQALKLDASLPKLTPT